MSSTAVLGRGFASRSAIGICLGSPLTGFEEVELDSGGNSSSSSGWRTWFFSAGACLVACVLALAEHLSLEALAAAFENLPLSAPFAALAALSDGGTCAFALLDAFERFFFLPALVDEVVEVPCLPNKMYAPPRRITQSSTSTVSDGIVDRRALVKQILSSSEARRFDKARLVRAVPRDRSVTWM